LIRSLVHLKLLRYILDLNCGFWQFERIVLFLYPQAKESSHPDVTMLDPNSDDDGRLLKAPETWGLFYL